MSNPSVALPTNMDVWIMAGQSNMEGVGELTHSLPPTEGVFSFTSAGRWEIATEPLHWFWESFTPVHRMMLRKDLSTERAHLTDAELARQHRSERVRGAGLGIAFGQKMMELTGRPIGLIPCAHGGTNLDQWSPDLKSKGGESLYGGMLERVARAGGKLRGILWYQGESEGWNLQAALNWGEKFHSWVQRVRADLNGPSLPVLIVQIAYTTLESPNAGAWNAIQQAQYQLPSILPMTAVTSAIDLSLVDAIHVNAVGLQRLGVRLAIMANEVLSGKPGDQIGPRLDRAIGQLHPDEGPIVDLSFTGVTGGWTPADQIEGFEVLTAEGERHPVARVLNARRHPSKPTSIRIRLSDSTGGFILTGGINTPGAFSTSGLGTGTVAVNSAIGTSVTSVANNSLGVLSLGGANTYAGVVNINSGSLTLDFTAAGAPASNILSTTSTVFIGGTGLAVAGKASTTNSQTIAGATIGAGTTFALNNNATANPTLVNLGTLTRNAGGTVNFTLANGASSASNGWVTSTANTDGTILGGWATFGGTTWATNNGTNIVGLATYSTDAWTSGTDADIATTGLTFTNATTNSLRFNVAAVRTMTLAGTNTITSGGILIGSTVAANTTTLTGGNLAGKLNGDLVLNNFSTAVLTINSTIIDNGAGTGLTKSGTGGVTLGGINTFNGLVTVNGTGAAAGLLTVSADANLGNVNNDIKLNNAGQLTVATNSLVINPLRNIAISGGGRLVSSGGTNWTVGGNITGNGSSQQRQYCDHGK